MSVKATLYLVGYVIIAAMLVLVIVGGNASGGI